MRCSNYLLITLTSPVIVAIAAPHVSALSSSEVARIAKSITIKLENSSQGKHGSGFIIKKDKETYHVLTAYHVVREPGKYILTAPDGEKYNIDLKKVRYQSGTDLAAIQFTSQKTYSIAKIGDSDKATEGTTSYVAGFWPATGALPVPTFRFIPGTITANATRPVDEGYQIAYTNATTGGISGGAVFNENGEVIAIHGRGEIKLDTNSTGEFKAVSTGNNVGIAIATFLRLKLLDVGINPPAVQVAATPKADDFFLEGNEKYEKRDFQGALERYNRAIEINPKYAGAYGNRGLVRSQLKQYKEAIADFDRSITLNPKDSLVYYNRGNARSNLGDDKGAIADYSAVIKLQPDYPPSYLARGSAKEKLGDKKGALADYEAVIALGSTPWLSAAYDKRGNLRSASGDRDGSQADFETSFNLNPDPLEAQFNRDYSAELRKLQAAIQKAPKNAINYFERGKIYVDGTATGAISDDRNRKALADFTKAIALQPNYPEAYFYRANLYSGLDELDRAVADYTQAIRFKPDYGIAMVNRGNIYSRLKRHREAIADFTKAIESKDPKTEGAWVYGYRAASRREIGDKKGAIADLDRAIALAPDRNFYYLDRADLKIELGDKPGAIADLTKARDYFLKNGMQVEYQNVLVRIEQLSKSK
jgi:tetratricopeptide (TPR) repeat protein